MCQHVCVGTVRLDLRFRLAEPLPDDELDCVVDRINDLADPDAVYSCTLGLAVIDAGSKVTTDADRVEAAVALGRKLKELGVPVVEVVADLVDLTEVAARFDVSHEAARKWATRDDFPAPYVVLSGGGRAWDWADLLTWARGTSRSIGDDGVQLTPVERARATTLLAGRHRPVEPRAAENYTSFLASPTHVFVGWSDPGWLGSWRGDSAAVVPDGLIDLLRGRQR